MSRILIGTCSWSQHAPFYPAELPKNQQISFYAQHFPLVEIDSTYYALVAERNFAAWAERTPSDFVFDVKPYRHLTQHDRRRRRTSSPSTCSGNRSSRCEMPASWA